MTENAGERLFQVIGQIPDEMVLEASKEHIQLEEANGQEACHPDADKVQKEDTDVRTDTGSRVPYRKWAMEKLGGYLKYLPVAACLCIVLGSAGYIMNNYIQKDTSGSLNSSGSFDLAADQKSDGQKSTDQDGSSYDSGADMAINEDAQEDGSDSEQKSAFAGQEEMRPVRYDTYEGPVFPLTATGDTQKLKVSRSLQGVAGTQKEEDGSSSLLKVRDVYKIKNTSKHDKTLQIVYPFAGTLNGAYALEEEVLQVTGEDSTPIAYSIGESIYAYRNEDLEEETALKEQEFREEQTFIEQQTTLETYLEIFDEQSDYQEQALAKEADWNKNVHVYTFPDISMQKESVDGTQQGVVGVTMEDAGADVLTYGFDHSFTKEDGSTTYCFFASGEQKKRMLIVTGDQSVRPQIGYYTNLDCEEEIEGLQYDMSSQEMSYTDALRLCSFDAARKMSEDYEQGIYAAELPVYMNEDAAFRVLTMMSEEDLFYDTLMQRYQSLELTEIFERLFAETRVIYARTTVTIPAKQSVQVTVQTQKCQKQANDLLAEDQANDGDITYDFLPSTQSRLPIGKTSVLFQVEDPWQVTEQNLGLKKERKRIWKVRALDEAGTVALNAADADGNLVLNQKH